MNLPVGGLGREGEGGAGGEGGWKKFFWLMLFRAFLISF